MILYKKVEWVDQLRGIGILAVILGHMTSPLTSFIYSWHIPLFFFIGGYLLNSEVKIRTSIYKDLKRLLVPFFIFGFIGIIIEIAKRKVFSGFSFIYPNFNVINEIKGLVIWMDINHMHHYGFVLWFLPALFWSKTVLLLLIKIVKNSIIIFIICSAFWCIFANQQYILPFAIDKGLMDIIFVFIGYYFRIKVEKNILEKYGILLIISLLIFHIPSMNLALKNVNNLLINPLYSMGVIIPLIIFIKYLKFKILFLSQFGINSMFIYIIHPYINNISYILVISISKLNWLIEFLFTILILWGLVNVLACLRKIPFISYFIKPTIIN